MPPNYFKRALQVGRAAYYAKNAYTAYNASKNMARAKTNSRRSRIPRTAGMQSMTKTPLARSPRTRKYYPAFNPANRYAKSRKLFYNIRTSGAGSTSSRSRFGTERVPKSLYSLYKTNQSYTLERLTSVRVASLYGKQAVYDYVYASSVRLAEMFATVPQTSGGAAFQQTGKFYLQKYTAKLTFTNQDLATAYVAMYEISPRFHIPLVTINPPSLWDLGFESQTASGSVNDDYRDAYASPFTSQAFCLYYKVDKVTKFELGQGQSHCHMMTKHVNKPVHGQIISNFPYLRDITHHNMIVISGTPLNDVTIKTDVTTSSCAVDLVNHTVYEYTYAANQRTLRTYSNSLPTITNAEIASIGAGIVTPEDEA